MFRYRHSSMILTKQVADNSVYLKIERLFIIHYFCRFHPREQFITTELPRLAKFFGIKTLV